MSHVADRRVEDDGDRAEHEREDGEAEVRQVRPAAREADRRDHATCNMQHATCNMQHATCNMKPAREADRREYATCDVHVATCNMLQHATCNMQHATCA